MALPQGLMVENAKLVLAGTPAVPSASTDGDWVSMKNYDRCTIVLLFNNVATVTGISVTYNQATAVAGTGSKAITSVTNDVWENADCAASDTLVQGGVTLSSNAFTTDTTDNKDLMYVREISIDDLDVANDFDCVQYAFSGSPANITAFSGLYILWNSRYAKATPPAAITD